MSSGDVLTFQELDEFEFIDAEDLLNAVGNCAINGLEIDGPSVRSIAEKANLSIAEAFRLAAFAYRGAMHHMDEDTPHLSLASRITAVGDYLYLQEYASQRLGALAQHN